MKESKTHFELIANFHNFDGLYVARNKLAKYASISAITHD